MKNVNQSFLRSGKLILSLLMLAVLFSFVAAQSNDDESLPTASSMKSRAASASAVKEFEKARLRSDLLRSIENASPKAAEANVVYQRTSHSSYNDNPADIFFVGKNQYEVDSESNKIVQFGPRPRTIDDPEPTAVDFTQHCSPKPLRQMAIEYASKYSSLPLAQLTESVTDKDGVVYFFRWETDTKKFDGLPAFVQIGLSCGGDLVSYTNTLDLKENQSQDRSVPSEAQSLSVGGVYIFANNGTNYDQYGPARYWWTTNNEGYCSTRFATWCNPKYMRYTYESWNLSNYATWDHPGFEGNLGTHKIFIPRVNATARWASYFIIYGGAGSASFALDQLSYSNVWVQTRTLRSINFTQLSDTPFAFQSPSGKKVAFDEIQVVY
ncbi:MAG: hypothetical protein H0U45_11640 [Tatlockia sp.]|jgi:hypothetical protein|nr:hypothetical protein [Tatlockia sp.]